MPSLLFSLGSSPFPSMLSGQTEDAKRSWCACLRPFLRVPIKRALPWVPQPTLWHPCWPGLLGPQLSMPAAPPFGPILSVPSDCSTPAACFGARFFLCGLQAHPQGSGWNLSPWPHPTSLVAGPLVSALPILTSPPKANIWEGRAVKGCLRPQFTP